MSSTFPITGTVMAGIVLFSGVSLSAGEATQVSFRRVQLSDQFWCEGASFGDFNRDGKNDIVAGPWWWEGPDFSRRHEIYPPAASFPLKLGGQTTVSVPGFEGALGTKNTYSDNFFAFPRDFNDDGWTDVLVIGFPGQWTAWFENPKGAAQAWKRHVVFLQTDNESPTFADITGDGKPELVCITKGAYGYAAPDWTDPDKPWAWHRITPDRKYGNFTHGLGLGDVDGDGRTDLVEKDGWWRQPASLEGDPEWTHHPFSFAAAGAQMHVYDVNGDGRNDIITALHAHGFGLAWYERTGNGDGISFRPHVFMNRLPGENRYGVKFSELHAVDLVDVDGDGLKDIVTGKRFWSHGRTGDPDRNDEAVLYWFRLVRGPDGPDWVPHRIDSNSGVGTQVVTGDIDGNGAPDVVIGNKKGVFVHLQERKTVSPEEYEKCRPKPVSPAAAVIRAAGDDGQPLNLDFEAGSLKDWTAEGTAFAGMPAKGDAVNRRRSDMRSGHAGEYWVGSYESGGDAATGTLTSVPFAVTQPYASFLIGGGSGRATRLEIINAASGAVLFTATGPDNEEMRALYADLRPFAGARIRLRLVDEATTGWGHINFDAFSFHDTRPLMADQIKSE